MLAENGWHDEVCMMRTHFDAKMVCIDSEVKDMNEQTEPQFKNYLSKPITRKALLIGTQFALEKVAEKESTWRYGPIEFAAHQEPFVGDYICYLNDDDVYHVDAKTFALRNELDDKDIEQEIQEKGLDAPRVTPDQIEKLMANVEYDHYIVPNTTTTVVTAMLMFKHESPFTLAIGMSATASMDNFDEAIGYKVALMNASADARKKLWQLEGYKLKCELDAAAEAGQ